MYLEQKSNKTDFIGSEISLDLSITIPPSGLITQHDFSLNDGIKQGSQLTNCGLTDECGLNEFALYLHTGFENKTSPKLCLDDTL